MRESEELFEEVEQLQRMIDALADQADADLERYAGWYPRVPPGWYWRMRWIAFSVLRLLEFLRLKRRDGWPSSLRGSPFPADADPLVIWGCGCENDEMRTACAAWSRLLSDARAFAPVLITDVADFAFFSRLHWLVEYVPELDGEGESYRQRKLRRIAGLYRGAPAFPLRAALDSGPIVLDMLSSLTAGASDEQRTGTVNV